MKVLFCKILLLFFGMIQGHAQSKPVLYETISIKNQQYLICDNWKTIPVNHNTGEDVSSASFTGRGPYKNPSSLTDRKHEGETAISRNYIEVKANILNETDKEFFIQSISLNIKNVYQLSNYLYETGTWNVPDLNGYSLSSDFEIDEEPVTYLIAPDPQTIKPKSEGQGSRVNLRITTLEETRNKEVILEFNIVLAVSTVGSENKTYYIESDKSYFIAAL